jgi:ABC-type transport system involved in multi-copper enzyme maturation permease subunit
MLNGFAIITFFIWILTGAAILCIGVPRPDTTQNLAVLGGATLLSLGLVTLALALKSAWVTKQNYKKWRNGH